MKSDEVLVSTTDSVDPGVVEAYFGLISAHVVVALDDFPAAKNKGEAASNEGTATAMVTRLRAARENALQQLRSQARDIGANCLLAARVDHETMWAGGQAFLVVTATSTAATVDTVHAVPERKQPRIAAEDLETALRNRDVLRGAAGGSLRDEDWDFIIENASAEFTGTALDQLAEAFTGKNTAAREGAVTRVKRYFASIRSEEAAKDLYAALEFDLPDEAADALVPIIGELGLVDYGEVLELVHSDDKRLRMHGVHLLGYDRAAYSEEDLPLMHALLKRVASMTPTVEVFTRKKKFSPMEDELWRCPCGADNDVSTERCPGCGSDVWGFPKGRINPPEAQRRLQDLIGAVTDILRHRSAA